MFLVEERVLEGRSAWMHCVEGEGGGGFKANVIAGACRSEAILWLLCMLSAYKI